jgi:hypothetical protein
MRSAYSRFVTLPIFLATLVFLPGCASFLQFGDHGEDQAEYDRGYESDSEYSEEAANTDSVATRELASYEEIDSNQSRYGQRRTQRAIAARDVVLGMTRQEVSQSWGQPTQREVAGRGSNGHERWTYGSRYSLNGARTVIFENGKVAGWSQ